MHGPFQRSPNFCIKYHKKIMLNEIMYIRKKVMQTHKILVNDCILDQWSSSPVSSILIKIRMCKLKEPNFPMG